MCVLDGLRYREIQCSVIRVCLCEIPRVASRRVCFEYVHEEVSYGSSHAKLRRGRACYTEILLIPNCVTVIATLLFGGEDIRGTWK